VSGNGRPPDPKSVPRLKDAWPLIAHASTPVEQRINAILNRLNDRMVLSLRKCDGLDRDWVKDRDREIQSRPPVDQPLTGKNAFEDDWKRQIMVTMTGPRFLSIVAVDGFVYCGSAHPNSDTLAMVFDLTTGRPVNWMNFIARSANASAYSDTDSDGTTVGADCSCTACHDSRQSRQGLQGRRRIPGSSIVPAMA